MRVRAETQARGLPTLVRRPEFAFFLGVGVLYAFLRLGSFVFTPVRVTDTATYEHVSAASLSSADFWAGARPFTVPFVWKVVGGDHGRIVAQLVVSVAAWLTLAAAVAACLRRPVVAGVGFVLVLAFAATSEIILWDPLLLSESLSLSLGALVVASWLLFVRRPTWFGVAFVVAVTASWTFARDSHAYVVLFAALAVLASLLERSFRVHKLALASACVLIFAASAVSAGAGLRWYQPMRDILLNRVSVDPEMRAYFEARHGPQWREADARRGYARYLLTHPAYALGDPFFGSQTTPTSSTDSASSLLDPDFRSYNDNASARRWPLPAAVDDLVYVHGVRIVVALALLVAAAAILASGFALPRTTLVPAVLLLSTVPHGLLVYHLSGLEVDRHALEVAVGLRVAVLLLALFTIDAVLASRRDHEASRT